MVYIKVLRSNVIVGVEAIEEPGYVRNQKDGIIRCSLPTAQGIISNDGSRIYQLADREALSGIEYELLNAIFIDVTEFERLSRELEPDEFEEDSGDEEQSEDDIGQVDEENSEAVMSELDMKVELLKLRAKDEATTQFFKTVMDPSTTSIAKIRAAAKECMNYRASFDE